MEHAVRIKIGKGMHIAILKPAQSKMNYTGLRLGLQDHRPVWPKWSPSKHTGRPKRIDRNVGGKKRIELWSAKIGEKTK
eukprot:9716960-Heterocapsa_arctica.AAC.1